MGLSEAFAAFLDLSPEDQGRMIASAPPEEQTKLAKAVESALKDMLGLPLPGPQTEAYFSLADVLLYGGSAGSAKSALLMLLGANQHTRSIIFRRELGQTDGLEAFGKEVIGDAARFVGSPAPEWNWPDGRQLKLAGMQLPDDWRKHAGRERDFIGFDEAGEFLESQVSSIMAWLRAEPGRRCRVVMASNPPRGNDGAWLLEWFAPWLDPQFANKAEPGELRWCVRWRGQTVWVDGPGEHDIEGEMYIATSRTFIPAALKDNPYRNTPEYRAKLQSLDEPLRSQLLYGDFGAGREDDEWQAIPTEWVRAAMNRWKNAPPYGVPMCAIGVDVAQGGADNTVLAQRYDGWFAPLIVEPGIKTPTGTEVAGLVITKRRNNAKVIIDVGGGFGADAHGHLKGNEVDSYPFMGLKDSTARTENKQHTFSNVRTQAWWRLREALNPDQVGGSNIFLPDDRDLMRDLVAPRYKYTKGDSQIELESKKDLVKRLGRSPDRGDAVAMAWFSGAKMASDYRNWKVSEGVGPRGNRPTTQSGRKLLTGRR